MRHLIVGTAGHIDHGKSALVTALTGTDPDRLKEEKARGITIELGFAELDLGEGRVLSFVDVPGHERFVRHMVAGAAGIDAVLLVVASDEGVKPQTREHLDICELLGIRHGVIALSKADLVEDELAQVVALEVGELVQGTFLEDAPLVRVSTRSGRGLDALRAALDGLLERIPPREAEGVARLPVDRSFVLRGFGTVVTGSLASGALEEGTEIEVLPGGRRGRIRGLQVHGRAVPRALAGQRTAVNLQGLSCEQAPRGAVLVTPGSLVPTRRIWSRVELLPTAPERLARGGPVSFHQGTSSRRARMRVLDREADGSLFAEVFLGAPTTLLPGDRFILRRPAPFNTVGGGLVIDIAPPRGRARAGEARELYAGGPDVAVIVRLARAGSRGRDPGELAAELGATRDELSARVEALAADGRVVRAGGRLFAEEAWRELVGRVRERLAEFHDREPLRPGISREELRGRVADALPQESWRPLLEQLSAAGVVTLDGERVALAAHRVVLSGGDRTLAERIEQRFLAAGLDPPETKHLLAEDEPGRVTRILDLLVARGRLVRIRGGRLFHAEPLQRLVDRLREYARSSRTIDVAAFKELAGVSRKNAIPLLEHFDQERLTRRVGNLREFLDV